MSLVRKEIPYTSSYVQFVSLALKKIQIMELGPPPLRSQGVTDSSVMTKGERSSAIAVHGSAGHHTRKIRWITLPFSNQQHHPKHRAWWSRRAIIIFTSAVNGLVGGRVVRNPSACCHYEFRTYMYILLPIWMRLKIIFFHILSI